MTYEDCLLSTFLDIQSWGIALAGLMVAAILKKFKRTISAALVSMIGLISAIAWAYIYYELNCVELYEA